MGLHVGVLAARGRISTTWRAVSRPVARYFYSTSATGPLRFRDQKSDSIPTEPDTSHNVAQVLAPTRVLRLLIVHSLLILAESCAFAISFETSYYRFYLINRLEAIPIVRDAVNILVALGRSHLEIFSLKNRHPSRTASKRCVCRGSIAVLGSTLVLDILLSLTQQSLQPGLVARSFPCSCVAPSPEPSISILPFPTSYLKLNLQT